MFNKQLACGLLVFMGVIAMGAPVLAESGADSNPVYTITTNMGAIDVELFAQNAPKTVANFIGLAEGTKSFVDPQTKKNVKRPYYDGLIFHRVMRGFMIQGGDPLGTGSGGPGYNFEDEIDAVALGLDKIRAMSSNGQPHQSLMIRTREDFQRNLLMPLLVKLKISSQKELDQRKDEVQAAMTKLTLMGVYENMGYRYSAKGSPHPPKRGVLAMANIGPNSNGSQFFINLADTDWLAGKHTVFGRVISGMEVVDKIGSVTVNDKHKPVKDALIVSIRKKKTN
jgi:cyclophilin family peptidyl-prolyl cis-trans isomerase